VTTSFPRQDAEPLAKRAADDVERVLDVEDIERGLPPALAARMRAGVGMLRGGADLNLSVGDRKKALDGATDHLQIPNGVFVPVDVRTLADRARNLADRARHACRARLTPRRSPTGPVGSSAP
jgi:hypothetical protein